MQMSCSPISFLISQMPIIYCVRVRADSLDLETCRIVELESRPCTFKDKITRYL
jgi:hypothetical protein